MPRSAVVLKDTFCGSRLESSKHISGRVFKRAQHELELGSHGWQTSSFYFSALPYRPTRFIPTDLIVRLSLKASLSHSGKLRWTLQTTGDNSNSPSKDSKHHSGGLDIAYREHTRLLAPRIVRRQLPSANLASTELSGVTGSPSPTTQSTKMLHDNMNELIDVKPSAAFWLTSTAISLLAPSMLRHLRDVRDG